MPADEALVRKTIQEAFSSHLRPDDKGKVAWGNIDTDFSDSYFYNLDFSDIKFTRKALFSNSYFYGNETHFNHTQFTQQGVFAGSTFYNSVDFSGSRWKFNAILDGSSFIDTKDNSPYSSYSSASFVDMHVDHDLLFNNISIKNNVDFGMLYKGKHMQSLVVSGTLSANEMSITDTTVDFSGAKLSSYHGNIKSSQNGTLVIGKKQYSSDGDSFSSH